MNEIYTCGYCSKKFVFKNSLKKHQSKGRCQALKLQYGSDRKKNPDKKRRKKKSESSSSPISSGSGFSTIPENSGFSINPENSGYLTNQENSGFSSNPENFGFSMIPENSRLLTTKTTTEMDDCVEIMFWKNDETYQGSML